MGRFVILWIQEPHWLEEQNGFRALMGTPIKGRYVVLFQIPELEESLTKRVAEISAFKIAVMMELHCGLIYLVQPIVILRGIRAMEDFVTQIVAERVES